MDGQPTEEPLNGVVEQLQARGYRETLRASGEGLRAIESGRTFSPEALIIDEIARFEGASDPDDEAAVFALSAPEEGPVGTYVVPFGPAMQAVDADVVHRLKHAPG